MVLRLSLTGGWDLSTPGALHLSIEDDGRVVRVTDTSVFSSTDDYTSARLSADGVRRVLELTRDLLPARRSDLDGGAGVSPTERSAWLEVGDDITLSMDRLGRTEGYTGRAAILAELASTRSSNASATCRGSGRTSSSPSRTVDPRVDVRAREARRSGGGVEPGAFGRDGGRSIVRSPRWRMAPPSMPTGWSAA